jgi:hypothetical protein
MTGFRTACPRPEKMEANGVGRAGICTLGAGRALSRSRETTVELHSDSEYADGISGGQENGGSSATPGKVYVLTH